ncbi:MAG: response regulator [Chitinivibrionales bacterium]
MARKRIVFIDDESVLAEMAGEMIEELGHEPVIFSSGKEAVDYFKKEYSKIDLVITDLMMPDMDGRDVIDSFLNIAPEIKITLMTGDMLNSEIEDILRAKIYDFIEKPFNGQELRRVIDKG